MEVTSITKPLIEDVRKKIREEAPDGMEEAVEPALKWLQSRGDAMVNTGAEVLVEAFHAISFGAYDSWMKGHVATLSTEARIELMRVNTQKLGEIKDDLVREARIAQDARRTLKRTVAGLIVWGLRAALA